LEKTSKHLKHDFKANGNKDDDLMIHILGNLTYEYKTLVDMLTKCVGASSDALTLDELTEELAAKYSRLSKTKKTLKQQEQALYITGGANKGGQKKIKGNAGAVASHKLDDCHWKKEESATNDGNNKSGNFYGGNKKFMKCIYCKKSGHTEDHCWKKTADEMKGEKASMAKEEHVIMCVEIDSDDDSVPPPLISHVCKHDSDISDEEPSTPVKVNKYFTGIPRLGDRRAYVCFYDSDSDSEFDDDEDDDSITVFDFNDDLEMTQMDVTKSFFQLPILENPKILESSSASQSLKSDSHDDCDESVDNVLDFEDTTGGDDTDSTELEGFACMAKHTNKELGGICNVSMAAETSFLLKEIKDTKDLWIADTGATCHLTNREDGMINLTSSNKEIRMGNMSKSTATKQGTLTGVALQVNKTTSTVILDEVSVVPELGFSLISITKAMKNGCTLSGDEN
jgi:hypothetical protein